MKKIAVLGASKPSLPFYKQAKKLGYHIIGIAWGEGAVCKEYCDTFYPVDYSKKDEVLNICQKEHIDGIISFTLETALPTLTYVVQEMGLVGNTFECLELTCTKFSQRRALENAGIPVPKYFLIENESQLIDIKCNFPVIVKPIDSGGSQGICKVDNPADLTMAFTQATAYSRTRKVIVEEYVDGREFSVEFISYKGLHYLVQITDKVTSGAPHFIEMSHHQPADIPNETWERIRNMVSSALTALKIENSASHTEIKLNSNNELFIIETGARMGGGHITSDLVRLSTGYDFVKGVIDLALGDFEIPNFTQSLKSGIYFYSKISPEIGEVIKNHDNYPQIIEWEISDTPLVEVKSNLDRRGYFIYQTKEERFNPYKNEKNCMFQNL